LTVQEALAASGIDAREARLLLAVAAGFSESSVVAFPEREISGDVESAYRQFVQRRISGEPVAYILGRKEFYGLELAVNPAVLIPRPETELVVEIALQKKPATVLDLGTGSGAIALALKRHLPASRVTAVEASAASLAVAQRNAVKHNLEVEYFHGQWFGPVAGRRFDLVVSNPPYVAEGDPHLEALRFEPRSALVSGAEGLDAIREITRQAPAHLAAGGWLLLEHGLGQDGAVRALLAGWNDVQTWPDLAGIPRVTGGRR
jgi:release factor glutamine methyltransferase